MSEKLNPIEQRMAQGMFAIAAFLTEATCGEPCWQAREDIYQCSCGGKNHGCMRGADGIMPAHTAKIDGTRYELRAVGNVEAEAQALNRAAGITYHYAHTAREHYGYIPVALMRSATKAQLEKWPELKAERERVADLPAYDWRGRSVYLLWVRVAA